MGYDGGNTYNQLWKSDGTDAGTVKIKSISSGPGVQGEFTVMNNNLFFWATTDDKEIQLWKSDGTNSGTVLVKDINSGYGAGLDYTKSYLCVVNGILYFSANDGKNGFELWRSDGTETGTEMVMDIDPTTSYNGAHPKRMTNVNGTLFFTPFEPNTGVELWALKTSTGITEQVKSVETIGIYPNPVQNILSVACTDKNIRAEVFNMMGTRQNVEMKVNEIDVSNLSPGTYFVKLYSGVGIVVQKFIKE